MKTSDHHQAEDGTSIWYGTEGEGPALVLCDGFACDGFIWPYIIDHFCESFRIVRWHYRGHGQSSPPTSIDHVDVETLCHDLHGVLSELEIDEAIFAGHSMGVQVILQYVGLYREQVRALVPICGTYKHPLDTFHNNDKMRTFLPYLERFVELGSDQLQALWSSLTPSSLSYLLASKTEINGKLVRRSDFQPYLEHVAHMDLTVFIAMLKELADHTTENILPDIAVPALIIAGELDGFTPLWRSREMEELIPNAELLVLPGGTHVGPIELPDMVIGGIDAFFARSGLLP
jgi:pimeloyl-ACP methyl ester carboxylesterase